jgi:pyruvate,water dikinase
MRAPNLRAVIEGGRLWREKVLPEVQQFDRYYREAEFDAMSNEELVAELDNLVRVRSRCGQLHSMATFPWWVGMEQLISTYRELTGGDDLGAVRLVQGYGNKSVEAGVALWRLSRLAASIPAVSEALQTDGTAGEQLSALDSEPSAQPFLEAWAAFLEEFGWRSALFEFAMPTWVEDPTVPLSLVRAYMEMPDYDPVAEHERLAAEREASLEEVFRGLPADKRERLEAAVEAARSVVSILEDHNYYIDQRVGVLPRRLVLAAGRRLASMGRLADASDVFYLHHRQVNAALLGEMSGASDLVEQCKARMKEWSEAEPPEYVGAAPQEAGPEAPDRFFGGGKLRSDRPGELKGHAASAGTARGPARVLAHLDEAGRLRPGDVLVTRTTMPPWTPLFAVASAVVTETGGVLSHAALTAREYGLPAVLSVENATRLIGDGQLVEVDGSKGIVRILQ